MIWAQNIGLIGTILERPSRILELNRNLVLDVLLQIQGAFHSCLAVSSEFEATVRPMVPQDTPALEITGRQHSGNMQNLIRRALNLRDKSMRAKARLEWALIKKESFEKLLKQLIEYNDLFEGLLDSHVLQTVSKMQAQSNLMMLQMTEEITELRLLIQAMQIAPQQGNFVISETTHNRKPSLIMLAATKARNLEIEQKPPTDSETLLAIDRFKFTASKQRSTRQYATFDKTDIWIEWQHAHQSIHDSGAQQTCAERIQKLVNVLCNPDKPEAFRTPNCLGYLHDVDRFGIVYNLPGSGCKDVVSLRDLIGDKIRLSLNTRVRISVMLVESLLYLHAVNWVHKGIRSDSVLFGSSKGAQSAALVPTLSGFDFSRPDLPEEETVKHDMPLEHDLYRHPALLIPPAARSSKLHDIYSMGLVLAEIALWKPIEEIVSIEIRRSKLSSVRGRMLDLKIDVMGAIAFQVGETYANAVASCIHGIERMEGQDESSPAEQVEIQRMFLESVVDKLRSVAI